MLTICLIAKNEGPNIEGCLASFEALAGKFLLVDTGSNDDTKKRASAAGAEIVDFKWTDDFSAARNFALEKIETPWVMMVDADHRMDAQNAKELAAFLKKNENLYDLLDLRCEFDGSFSYLPRVWRTGLKLKYKYPVHEYLEMIPNLRRINLDFTIQDPLARNHHKSREYYVKIMESYVKRHSRDHRMLYYLISDSRFLKHYEESIYWAQQYLRSDPPSNDQVARALVHMGRSLKALKQWDEAEKAFSSAMQFDSQLIEPYLCLGDLHFLQEDFIKALDFYFKAADCTFKLERFHKNEEMYAFEPKAKLARTFAKLNEKGKAIQYAEEALKIKPTDITMNELLNTLTQAS